MWSIGEKSFEKRFDYHKRAICINIFVYSLTSVFSEVVLPVIKVCLQLVVVDSLHCHLFEHKVHNNQKRANAMRLILLDQMQEFLAMAEDDI